MNGPSLDQSYLDSPADFGEPAGVPLPPAERPELKIFSANSLVRTPAPERRWLVPNMIAMARVTLLYGNGGDGKSLLELQLGVAVASGADWAGKLPQRGPALILSGEDDIDEVHRRLADIIAGREDINVDDLANLKIVDLAGQDAVLAFPDNRGTTLKKSPLFGEIERLVEKYHPVMLGVDTLADVYGGDENIRGQVRQFLGFLTGLAIKFDVAVVVLAHPSLSGITSGSGTGGSTAWHNSVRGRLYLAPLKSESGDAPDPSLKQLTVMKPNYGPAGETIPLRWERGRFVLAGRDWKSSLTNVETDNLFLDLLDQFTREGRNVTAKKGPSYAPSEFANHAEAKGVSKEAFKKAMDRLLGTAKIENMESGSPSRRRSKLVRTGEESD
jgi:RecA-family ATPase